MPRVHPNEPPQKDLETEAQTTSAASAEEAAQQRPTSDDDDAQTRQEKN